GKLCDRQRLHRHEAREHRDDRDDDGDDGTADEEAGHRQRSSGAVAEGVNGVTRTTVPSRVAAPSTTTRAPGCSPSSMTHRLPMRSPTFTVFVLTVLSWPTMRTWNDPWSSFTARCGTSSATVRARVRARTRRYCPGR